MLDIRPMAWQATVIAPCPDAGVTVVVRVTYHSIEALCGDDEGCSLDEVALN